MDSGLLCPCTIKIHKQITFGRTDFYDPENQKCKERRVCTNVPYVPNVPNVRLCTNVKTDKNKLSLKNKEKIK